jgi:hypothetical protein
MADLVRAKGSVRRPLFGFACLALASAVPAQAQLFKAPTETDGFGAPVLKLSRLGDDFIVLFGGRGGWIGDHKYVVGAGAYWLATNIGTGGFEAGKGHDLGTAQFGLELEYVILHDKLIHPTVMTFVGAGRLEYGTDGEVDWVFSVEPVVNLVLILTRYSRLGVGVGYRYVSGAQLEFSNSDLSQPTANITLKLGTL